MITTVVVILVVLVAVIFRCFKDRVARPRRKESLDSMYNVRHYVQAVFPHDATEIESSRGSFIDDDQVDFGNAKGNGVNYNDGKRKWD